MMIRCQRCGSPLRDGQAVCIPCGSPTGMRVIHKPTGIGCIGLVIGFVLIVLTIGTFIVFAIVQHS